MTHSPQTDYRRVALFVGIIVVIVVLWDTWAVYPLRLLVVFFHELSHGVTAMATGGSIVEIRLNAREGGLCITRGGSQFLVLSAGYLGSLIWGGVLLTLASRTRASATVLELLGALLLLVSIVWIRPVIGFGFLFGAAAGVAVAAAAYFVPVGVNRVLLAVIGLTSCLYAVLDIKSDILDRPHALSDAVLLAQYTGVPSVVWGTLWLILSLLVASRFLVIACRRDPGDVTVTSVPAP